MTTPADTPKRRIFSPQARFLLELFRDGKYWCFSCEKPYDPQVENHQHVQPVPLKAVALYR